MNEETCWTWTVGRWVEVYRVPKGSHYLAVDSRISREPLYLSSSQVYATKPDWTPGEKTGTKMRIKIRRILKSVDAIECSRINEDALFNEIDDFPEECDVDSVEILSVEGYDATHLCNNCEEFSAVNPDEHAPCRGCGRADWISWPFTLNKPVVGPLKRS